MGKSNYLYILLLFLLISNKLFCGQWNDIDHFLCLNFDNKCVNLVSFKDLKFCKFPSDSYECNDFSAITTKKFSIKNLEQVIKNSEKLSLFCIDNYGEKQVSICGIEVPHLTRISCAYVFKNLPDNIDFLEAYLVPADVAKRYINNNLPDQDLNIIDDIDNHLDDLLDSDIESLDLSNILPTEPINNIYNYKIISSFIQMKDYIISKLVLILYNLFKK